MTHAEDAQAVPLLSGFTTARVVGRYPKSPLPKKQAMTRSQETGATPFSLAKLTIARSATMSFGAKTAALSFGMKP